MRIELRGRLISRKRGLERFVRFLECVRMDLIHSGIRWMGGWTGMSFRAFDLEFSVEFTGWFTYFTCSLL